MSFRQRQKLHLAPCAQVFQQELVELPTGEFVVDSVNQSEKTMPNPELFELKNQLKAGVALEEVNSKVLMASKVDADKVVRKYTKQTAPKSEEVNNENE